MEARELPPRDARAAWFETTGFAGLLTMRR
jgi:hypothetical protein